jgi:hypothetical protein
MWTACGSAGRATRPLHASAARSRAVQFRGSSAASLNCQRLIGARRGMACAAATMQPRAPPAAAPRADPRRMSREPAAASSHSFLARAAPYSDILASSTSCRVPRRRAPPALLRLRAHLTQASSSFQAAPRSLRTPLCLSLSQVYSSDDRGQSDRYKPNLNQTLRLYSLYSMGSRETLYAILTSIEPEIDRARGGERADVVPDAARYMQNVGL